MLMTPAQQLGEICAYPDGVAVRMCGGQSGLRGAALDAAVERVTLAMSSCADVYERKEATAMRRVHVGSVPGMPRALEYVLKATGRQGRGADANVDEITQQRTRK